MSDNYYGQKFNSIVISDLVGYCQGFGCKKEYDETFEELYRPWLCSFNRLAHF